MEPLDHRRWHGGPDRGVGGKYLLIPPGYDGPLPDGGFFMARARTTRLFLCGRAFLEHNDPAPGVERVKNLLRIYPYVPGGYGTSIGDIVAGGPAPALPWTADPWNAALQKPAPRVSSTARGSRRTRSCPTT
ncbi:DUF1254 domain-containing protein [Rhodococcus opacus]|uniref:DUF1254 domain-containing protein n=1 Tax=Rhodococcus opacus TaxID=37919 RepID=UPI0018C8B58C|nr:DUF1254 domain-containing protein [Rhodococcus opacus]